MSIAFVTHCSLASGGANSATTGACDTTGADFIAIAVSSYSANPAPSISDNKGNTWTALNNYTDSTSTVDRMTLYYCTNPTVGPGHTFTASGTASYCGICAAAFSGVLVVGAFDVQNGAGASSGGTTFQPGSVTPTQNNELVLTGLAGNAAAMLSISSPFAIADSNSFVSGTTFGCAIAYQIQTTAAAENPTWTSSASNILVAAIAAFKASTGLTIGSISQTGSSGVTTINLTVGVATGGTPAYTYQWQRSPHGGSSWANVGTNSTSLADTGLTEATSYDYRCTVTDAASSTATSGTFSVATLLAVDDANVTMTPGNWKITGSSPATNATTNRGGSEFRFGFTGTSATLVLNMTNVSTPTNIGIAWTIDDGPRQTGNPAATVALASGLAAGNHTCRFWNVGQSSAVNCWTVDGSFPDYVVNILGVQLDVGASTAAPPSVPTDKMGFSGDSIPAGFNAEGSSIVDSVYAYPTGVAAGLNAEPSFDAFSSAGYTVTAGGSNVPPFGSWFPNYWNGVARTLTGLFKRWFVNLGHNDSGSFGATVASDLTALRTALGAATKIYVIVPFMGSGRAAITTGFASYGGTITTVSLPGTGTYQKCANDANAFLIDLGANAQTGLGGTASYQSVDGIHPNVYTHTEFAAQLVQAVQQIEGGSGIVGGGAYYGG